MYRSTNTQVATLVMTFVRSITLRTDLIVDGNGTIFLMDVVIVEIETIVLGRVFVSEPRLHSFADLLEESMLAPSVF